LHYRYYFRPAPPVDQLPPRTDSFFRLLLCQPGAPGHEVVPEEGAPLDTPHHDVVQGARRVEAWTSRHGRTAVQFDL
jgi:hypothetical protein